MKSNCLVEPLENLEDFKILTENLKNNSTILCTGISPSQNSHLIDAITRNKKNSSLVITSDELSAKKIYDDLNFFSSSNVFYYPSKDVIFYDALVKSKDIIKERFKVISNIISKSHNITVLSIEALFDRLTPFEIFKEFIFSLNVGMEISIENLEKKLCALGYKKRGFVEFEGQYSIRGGILDIFIPNDNNGYRLEFFGDEIDSIRTLHINSQRSLIKTNSFYIFPVREFVFSNDSFNQAIENITSDYKKTLSHFEKNKLNKQYDTLLKLSKETLENLKETKNTKNLDSFISYFYKEKTSLLDYLKKDTTIFISEPLKAKDSYFTATTRLTDNFLNKISNGAMLKKQLHSFNAYDDILNSLKNYNTVLFSSLLRSVKDFTPQVIINFHVKETLNYNGKISLLLEDIEHYKKNNFKIVVLCGNKHSATKIIDELHTKNIIGVYSSNLKNKTLSKDTIFLTQGLLNNGFEYSSLKFVLLSGKSLFTSTNLKSKKRSKSTKNKNAIKTFSELKIGDYVVHISHGVSVFKGVEKITTKGISKDYIKLAYKDQGVLFIPTDQMDLIQKFSSSDSTPPKLNKLGGVEWHKTKLKTKRAINILAEELIELYSIRKKTVGFKFSKDTVWQEDFENTFSFTETNDQLLAIADVKKDMESSRLMDRLICGDVGYGKTEIALRGAFKAIQDGKQVAYLVPTTILAQQVFCLFEERISAFSGKVSVLSRFNTPKEKITIKNALKSGYCDVVIGTHALLSKNIEFKDLGLVIIDEEQRFGVTHKEKLKVLKNNVDVLTLTATPIPRTLHMSLTGIKDMSLLEEPPIDRTPIQTYLLEFDHTFIIDAVNREIFRSGQVYFLHNSVNTIDHMTNTLRKILPDIKINFAHGQMPTRTLENRLNSFINKEFDLLVCTTIIETGLDISNVNTIIINNADKMGLSQLYQLRGRVGRSNRSAFCYLMYDKNKSLSEIAEKRLKTIRDFTEFGSGFKIAMKDLEIRGSGSLLGMEQSGHINAVGYDMYCMLLDNAVSKLKGEKPKNFIETLIDIKISAYIPSTYIIDEVQKLYVYKKISFINNIESLYDVEEEIEDKFGTIPTPVMNLLKVSRLKFSSSDIGILSVSHNLENTVITFKGDAMVDTTKIIDLQKENRGYKFSLGETPTLKIDKLLNVDNLLTLIKHIVLK